MIANTKKRKSSETFKSFENRRSYPYFFSYNSSMKETSHNEFKIIKLISSKNVEIDKLIL